MKVGKEVGLWFYGCLYQLFIRYTMDKWIDLYSGGLYALLFISPLMQYCNVAMILAMDLLRNLPLRIGIGMKLP